MRQGCGLSIGLGVLARPIRGRNRRKQIKRSQITPTGTWLDPMFRRH